MARLAPRPLRVVALVGIALVVGVAMATRSPAWLFALPFLLLVLFVRIRRSRAPIAEEPAVPGLEDLLGKGARPTAEWFAALQRLEAAKDREATVQDGRLWLILDDPTFRGSARIGAALLLRGRMTEVELARLRAIAEETESSELRGAFLAVSKMPEPLKHDRLARIVELAGD